MVDRIQNVANQVAALLAELHEAYPNHRRVVIVHEMLERALEHVNALTGGGITVQSGGTDKD